MQCQTRRVLIGVAGPTTSSIEAKDTYRALAHDQRMITVGEKVVNLTMEQMEVEEEMAGTEAQGLGSNMILITFTT